MTTGTHQRRLAAASLLMALLVSAGMPWPAAAEMPTESPNPSRPAKAPSGPSWAQEKYLKPADASQLSVDDGLREVYQRQDISGMALAWNDAVILFDESSGLTQDEAKTLIRAKSGEIGGATAPVVAWLTGQPSDEFVEIGAAERAKPASPSSRANLKHELSRREIAKPAGVARQGTQDTWSPNEVEVTGAFTTYAGQPSWKVNILLWWNDQIGSPQNIPSTWGFETTVWTRSDGVRGTRSAVGGACEVGNPDSDYVGSFAGDPSRAEKPLLTVFESVEPTNWAAVEPYQDWDSGLDKCFHQNYDIGLGEPAQLQPSLAFGWGIRAEIVTKRGSQMAGSLHGYHQAVKDTCIGVRAATECMDLEAPTWTAFPYDSKNSTYWSDRRTSYLPGKVTYSRWATPQLSYSKFSPVGSRFGDATGDGLSDVVFVRADGSAAAYRGGTNGLSSLGSRVQPFPADVTSLNKVPDMNGDRYSDFLYRTPGGGLSVMLGGPSNTLSWALPDGGEPSHEQQVWGSGWNGLRGLSAGRSGTVYDLYAIGSDQSLIYYRMFPNVDSSGLFSLSVTNYGQKGQNWGAIASMVRFDFDGDGTMDILAVTASGQLILYKVGASGAIVSSVPFGFGWGGLSLSNTGDLTGDGKDDLLVRDGDGTVFVYPRGGTGFGPRVEVGHGFSGSGSLLA